MKTYYDDNFGAWDIENADDVEFYRQIQHTNVEKTCIRCGDLVHIQPQYDICGSCADILESGGGF